MITDPTVQSIPGGRGVEVSKDGRDRSFHTFIVGEIEEESERRALEDFGNSRIIIQSIVRSVDVGLLSVGLMRNLQCSRQHTKRRVFYPDTSWRREARAEAFSMIRSRSI